MAVSDAQYAPTGAHGRTCRRYLLPLFNIGYRDNALTLVPLRDRLQLERRAFDDPILLTLFGKLIRCQVPERAMGSARIVINPPCFDLRFRICERNKLIHVEALVAQPPVQRFDERVFDRFTRPNEIQLHATSIRPIFKRPRLKLGAVVDCDRPRDDHAVEDPI